MWSAIKRIGRNVVFGSTMYREVLVNITPFVENKQDQRWRYTQITAWEFALLETFIPRKERGDLFTNILLSKVSKAKLSKAETVVVWPYITGEKSNWGMLNFIKPVVVPIRSLARVIDLVLQFPNAALQKSFCKNERILLDEKVPLGRRILSGLGCTALFIPMTPVRILAGISHAILAPIDTIKGIVQIFSPKTPEKKTTFDSYRDSLSQYERPTEISCLSKNSVRGISDSLNSRPSAQNIDDLDTTKKQEQKQEQVVSAEQSEQPENSNSEHPSMSHPSMS